MPCSPTRCKPSWTTGARSFAAAALFALAAAVTAPPARGAIETDPAALYATMKRAYDEGTAKGWPFEAERYYEATVFDAGRSYTLFRPDDPENAELMLLAVGVATRLHYNPLTDDNAATWYLRTAAVYAQLHGDANAAAAGKGLLDRLDAADADPRALAAQAEIDARAVAADFHNDPDALVQVIVADVRAYNLTKDARYRSALLQETADPGLPLVRVPDPESGEMFAFVKAALDGGTAAGFTAADVAAARVADDRRRHDPDLRVIGTVHAVPHDVRLTRTAPADEYFGRTKLSPLGVRNEIIRINKYLDVGWGDRMASDAHWVEDSIVDWQEQYPHDPTMARHLLQLYHLLVRVGAPETKIEAGKIRELILVQYAGSPQALELAAS
jgi:hypothetical protein